MRETEKTQSATGPRLTIRVSRHSLSFSAVDDKAENGVDYRPYTLKSGMSAAANMREALKTDEWLGTWQRALVMTDAPVMMVPADVFRSDTCEELYNHTFIGHHGDAVMHTVLPSLGAVAVFGVNKDLRLVVTDNFKDVRFMHVCVPVWNHLYRRSFTGPRQKLYGYCHDKKIEIFSFRQNRLRFCNTYDVSSSHDMVYYLLYVWKQTGMDQWRDELHLVGDLPDKDVIVGTLRRYLQNAYVINPSADFNRSPITRIKGLPYDLMTMYVRGR